MVDIKGMFDGIAWDSIKPQEDFNAEILALRGDYKGSVKQFEFVEYGDGGFYSMNIQITETVKGVKGDNRYVSRTFNIGATEWGTEEENKERLIVALKTMGVTKPEDAVGKTICMKIRPKKDKEGKVKRDKNDWPQHVVTIVTKFNSPAEPIAPVDSAVKVPF